MAKTGFDDMVFDIDAFILYCLGESIFRLVRNSDGVTFSLIVSVEGEMKSITHQDILEIAMQMRLGTLTSESLKELTDKTNSAAA